MDSPSFFLWAKLLDHDFSHSLASLFNSLSPLFFLHENFTNPCFCPRICHLLLHKVSWVLSIVHSAPMLPHRVTTCLGEFLLLLPFCLWSAAYPSLSASSKLFLQVLNPVLMLKKLSHLRISIRLELPPHASFWLPRNLSIATPLSLPSEVKVSYLFDINLPSVLFITSIFIFFLYPQTGCFSIIREAREPTKVTQLTSFCSSCYKNIYSRILGPEKFPEKVIPEPNQQDKKD